MPKIEEIRIRDPFIVAHEGSYYLYGTIGEDQGEKNLHTFISTDLKHWSEPKRIFTLPEDSWGKEQLWAPEVHRYNGKFYLFVSILGKHGLRGTQIAVSDTSDGEFIPIINKPATPFDRSCIDGTLYVEDGIPYIVYSADWPDNYHADRDVYIGEIKAAQLTEDLREMVGEPFLLFASDEVPLSAKAVTHNKWEGKDIRRYGSDGPFLRRLSDGTLFLIWSPIPGGNYMVLGAVSENGRVTGRWKHLEPAVFDRNGGHGMFFEDFDGSLKMCIHCPERYPDERAVILDVAEESGSIRLK